MLKTTCHNGYVIDSDGNHVFPFFHDDKRKTVNVGAILQSCGLCHARFPVVNYLEHEQFCIARIPWMKHLQRTSPLNVSH